jgi:hypothetical protein
MENKYNLTDEEANLIKDLLKHIGGDDDFNQEMANAVGMEVNEFNSLADSIFVKLGNGRLTVEG